MFIKIMFKRFGLKENKYFMAFIYGLIYGSIALIVFLISSLFIRNPPLFLYFLGSVFITVMMFIVYLVKWELSRFV